MHFLLFKPSRPLLYLFTFPALSFTKPASQTIVASSDAQEEPRITRLPSFKNLEIRDNNQSQNFIGYYYVDDSWQSTDCGTQTFAVSSLLGYCCTTGSSCGHPTGCSAGYVLGPQGPFACEGSGYTCGTAFLAPSSGAEPVTSFIHCYPPGMTLTSWYRATDLAVASTTSSSTTSVKTSGTASSVSSFSATLTGSSTTQTLPPSPTPSTNSLQRSSEVASIVGPVVGFITFVAATVFGIDQWKKRRAN